MSDHTDPNCYVDENVGCLCGLDSEPAESSRAEILKSIGASEEVWRAEEALETELAESGMPATAAGRALLTFLQDVQNDVQQFEDADSDWAAPILAIEEQARVAPDARLREALREALDGWLLADGAADGQFRISSDPPCEDEARIAELRALLAEPKPASPAVEGESDEGELDAEELHHTAPWNDTT